MDKFRQISTEFLPLIRVENWFPCSILRIFFSNCLPTLYLRSYLRGVVWDYKWVNFGK